MHRGRETVGHEPREVPRVRLAADDHNIVCTSVRYGLPVERVRIGCRDEDDEPRLCLTNRADGSSVLPAPGSPAGRDEDRRCGQRLNGRIQLERTA
jgi:hypothetical protein